MKYPEDFINKIICGDCLEVMNGIKSEVSLILTSPPYNVGIKYEDYNDNMKLEEYETFLISRLVSRNNNFP